MMNNLKVGDVVVALETLKDDANFIAQPICKGHEYKVDAVDYCPHCAGQNINVGYGETDECSNQCNCDYCKKDFMAHDALLYSASKYFILKEDIQEVFEEALQNEDYELASILRDLKITTHEHQDS